LGEKKWPNQSVNQYAEYQTYTIALQEFIHSVTEEKTTFFYSDLTDTCDEKTLNEELNDLFSLKTNTLILFRANIKLDTQTLINAKIWSTTQTTLIDISAKSHFVVLYNYTIKNPLLNSRALTPDKKQQLKRKAFRWQQNFQQMNETEKKLIINTLLSQLYQNNKT
jgi:DNA/RNA endonuclease G (NUC1)